MTKPTADKIIDLIAREAERAYRRGFQQGKHIGPHLDGLAVAKWRYRQSLASAPTPESGKPLAGMTPRDRLETECGTIARDVEAILSKGRRHA